MVLKIFGTIVISKREKHLQERVLNLVTKLYSDSEKRLWETAMNVVDSPLLSDSLQSLKTPIIVSNYSDDDMWFSAYNIQCPNSKLNFNLGSNQQIKF